MKQEGCKVLVVDDNDLILELSEDALSDAGYAVIKSKNGVDGLRAVDDINPDVVLLDIRMPVMDGFMFLKELRDKNPDYHGKIIILSAEVSEREIIRGLEAGAHDYQVVEKAFRLSGIADLCRYLSV